MANLPRQNTMPLGATFIPGGTDDFYMPEVISPSPQRITPEVPEKIQTNLAALELEANPPRRLSSLQSPELEAIPANRLSGLRSPSPIDGRKASLASLPSPSPASRSSSFSAINATQNGQQPPDSQPPSDHPTFSPFPPLRNRPANVPPADEERETILDKARAPVLNSTDPEVQLSWAQDALTYVDIAAQYELRTSQRNGVRPPTPNIEHQLRVDAVNIVNFLADQHHPRAEFLRGMWLEFGKFGFRMDKKEAFRCYQRSAQKGYARSEYRMGTQFEYSNDIEKAIRHYQLGVENRDSASNYRLGMMALLGQHGQPQDFARGVSMIKYAAESADENAPQGAYVYGMLLARDLPQVSVPEHFLPANQAAARYNIEKAAYLGFAKAQSKMGLAYELSQLGCDFNPLLSLHYNALASKQGEADADMSISKWFLCGYEGAFDKNENLAFDYAQRAAQTGLATAEFAMGYFYEVGIYVQMDLKVSRSWYEKAAEHGNKDALARIDGISRSKTLSRKDHDNIAVAKIKSQYGSHRGNRPERFKQQSTPMSPIQDETVEMPEPNLPPPRQPMQVPYPSNYGNYGPTARPQSVAPYPVDDDRPRPLQQRPPNGQAYQHYPPRRASHNPAGSPTQSESSFPDSNMRGSAFPTFKPHPPPGQKPAQSHPPPMPQAGGSYAPPTQTYRPGPGPAQPPHPQAPFSPPMNATRPNAQNPLSPPVPASRPNTQTPLSPPMNASRPTSTQPPPSIDIGFSAPPDFSGADRRRLQKPNDQRPQGAGGLQKLPSTEFSRTGRPGAGGPTLSTPSIPSSGRAPSPNRRPIASTAAPASGPAPQSRPGTAPHMPEKPPKLQDPAGAGRASNTSSPTTSTAHTRLPGKGPKTFQEMGVPAGKNESDCVVM